jgi:hypothetical protein
MHGTNIKPYHKYLNLIYSGRMKKFASKCKQSECLSRDMNIIFTLFILLFSLALQPSAGYGLLVHEVFVITHNDVPQSVGLVWTSDQLVAETST